MHWPKDIAEAKEIQKAVAKRVRIVPLKNAPRLIAGVDAAFAGGQVVAVASLYEYPGIVHVEDASSLSPISFPYVPGYLSFREGRAIIDAVRKLKRNPDVILVDGQGVAHPRGVGIASHIGVLLRIPSIGCAKSRLIGDYREPGLAKGRWAPLRYEGRIVGAVVRTRSNVNPLFVSPGHLITLDESIEIILACTAGFRIPEPLRRADHVSKKMAKSSPDPEKSH